MTEETTIVDAEVSHRVADIAWPRDKYGFVSGLRKAIVDALQETRGHPDKLDLVYATIEHGIAFARARGPFLTENVYNERLGALKRAAEEAAKDAAEKNAAKEAAYAAELTAAAELLARHEAKVTEAAAEAERLAAASGKPDVPVAPKATTAK